ncbi:MAG: hypothetical protein JXA89_24155 [Anaerolineae bacterium]|nr:hypothetical protein [Anaerolineae bacterium]
MMTQDPALLLKQAVERGEPVDAQDMQDMLARSMLIARLLTDPKQKPRTFVGLRAHEWRLLELCEIPFTHTLDKVQQWLDLLVCRTAMPEGFSLTGHRDGLLACHNAMIATMLIKMGYPNREQIDAGIDWIRDYQSVERGMDCPWTGKDLFTKYGGCMKRTPCFYGVVKSMIALTEYKSRFGSDNQLDDKLARGLEYILQHHVYKRLSTGEPIEPSIVQNFYPYPYKTNLIEALSLLKANGLLGDPCCGEAIAILKDSQRPDGFWQADTAFMKAAWVDFDEPKTPGPWISYAIGRLLAQ